MYACASKFQRETWFYSLSLTGISPRGRTRKILTSGDENSFVYIKKNGANKLYHIFGAAHVSNATLDADSKSGLGFLIQKLANFGVQ